MKSSRMLLTALAGFLVFVPITFLWHTVLFTPFYLGPDHAVKSADAFDPVWIVAANLVLCLGMAAFLPAKLGDKRRLAGGAIVGALFASMLIDYHNFSLLGLFPGQDPPSLYWLDAAWALIDGAITGVVMTLVHDRLGRRSPATRATPAPAA
jgi:uncharacterized membrane protein YkvI